MATVETRVKVRENRLRQAVARQGCILRKVRRIDPRAIDYGHYRITQGEALVVELASLDAVEAWVNRAV